MSELVLFEQKQVRRLWRGEAWWFVIADVVAALTNSTNPSDYLKKLRKRDPFLGEAFKGGGQLVPPLHCRLPLLAARRMKEIYRQKGYSDAWIEKRVRGIAVRDELTDEWKKRGVKEDLEYSILTAEISKATFGMTPSQYREHKALANPADNLRDHMSDLELIFTVLGSAPFAEQGKGRPDEADAPE